MEAPDENEGSDPLDAYVAPALRRTGFWRFLLGIVLILGGWFLWTVVVLGSFVATRIGLGDEVRDALRALSELMAANRPGTVLLQLATFIGIWPAAALAVRLLHAQSFGTLLSPEGRMRWRDFGGGLALAAAFWLVTMVFALAVVGAPVRTNLSLNAWLLAIAPLAVLVFIQASAEELIFRGYMLQQLAARWRNPLIWAALPAILFGLAHYSGGAAQGIGMHYVVVTALFGMAAAALVWRTGSVSAAMGLHTGMNMFSLSMIGLEGVVEGTQLFLYKTSSGGILFMADGLATLAILAFVLSPLCPFGPRNRATA